MRLTVRNPFPVLYALMVLILLMAAGLALGADCLEDGGLLRQSLNCTGLPTIPKYFDPTTFVWRGQTYLVGNDGNELVYWRLADPAHPTPVAGSNFNIPNQGDSDYDLLNYSICDDCRYGVGIWKLGTVIWDAGDGAAPRFGARHFYGTSSDPRGAYTYSEGGVQYLIAKYLPGDLGGEGTLYRVTGVEALEPVAVVDVPGVLKIANGIRLGDVLYLGMTDNWIYAFRIAPGGLTSLGRLPLRAFMLRGKSLSVDGGLAVTGFLTGTRLWDVRDPAEPWQLALIPGSYKLAALRGRFLWLVNSGDVVTTYDVVDPAQPVLMDAEFWQTEPPRSECDMETGGVFSPDASVLYLTRYAVFQMIGFGHCPPAEPPMFADGFESGDMGAWSSHER